jgi:hypothetical protein
MRPTYWKPKYGTRSSRHKAWVRQEQKREDRMKSEPRSGWLRRLLRR